MLEGQQAAQKVKGMQFSKASSEDSEEKKGLSLSVLMRTIRQHIGVSLTFFLPFLSRISAALQPGPLLLGAHSTAWASCLSVVCSLSYASPSGKYRNLFAHLHTNATW